MGSGSLYDFIATTCRGAPTSTGQRARAFAIPVGRWERVLGFEGCTVQFHRALERAGLAAEAPPALCGLLRDATSTALRRALQLHGQLAEVAAIADRAGIRVMALKGAARLLAGELPATRSLGDIDLLTREGDARRLHRLLRDEAGYSTEGRPYPHHLPGLVRGRSLGIEVHVRLTPDPLPLDEDIWVETTHVVAGAGHIEVPSPTNLLLHTLEHAARVNWTGRYRLRDILDVATVAAAGVDENRLARYVASSDCREAMATIVGAARTLCAPVSPQSDRRWRTVRRVGRVRIALAARPRSPRTAERLFRYAGVIAEGSPRTVCRAGLDLARRFVLGTAVLAMAFVSGCGDAAAPRSVAVGPLAFAANSGGSSALYRVRAGSAALVSTPGSNDRQPQSVGGRIVFTSSRDGDEEIYAASLNADLTLGPQTRLTTEYGSDAEPALSPSAATIAFVSERSGTPRIWLMDASGANPRPFVTGSPGFVPEGSPRWSPSGDRIAFTSTRSGSSQVWVAAADGGAARQISHETRGAFTPSWLPDGSAIVFTALSGTPRLLSVPAAGGDAVVFATDSAGLGEPSCGPTMCLAVVGPLGSAAHVVVMTTAGQRIAVSIPQVADDHSPAFLTR